MSIEVPFQTALFTVLDAAKIALGVNAVYDIRPQPTDGGSASAFPYIVMGDIYAVEWDSQTRVGFQITNRIHVFSRSGSKLECKGIQGRIYELLHRKPMSITGFKHINQFREDTQCDARLDGATHGICEYFGHVETL